MVTTNDLLGSDELKSEPAGNHSVRIVMLGDSITHAGDWNELLGREDVLNGGMPGWTSEQISWLVKDLVVPNKPHLCFYMAGINDISLGIPEQRIINNHRMILDFIHEAGTIPAYQTTLYQLGNKRVNREINQINQILKDYCSQKNYEFLDLRPWLCMDSDLLARYTYDGTHLTPDAYPEWAKAIRSVLEKLNV